MPNLHLYERSTQPYPECHPLERGQQLLNQGRYLSESQDDLSLWGYRDQSTNYSMIAIGVLLHGDDTYVGCGLPKQTSKVLCSCLI